jgi:uncharacterized protein YqjF (DUF2071 family)
VRLTPPPLLTMRWEHLLFAHWAVSPSTIAAAVPAPLEPDLFDGLAYVGIVPFAMRRVRPLGVPLPNDAISFGEVNVRTYVRAPDGTTGILFWSLDGDHRVAALAARTTYGIPYRYAHVRVRAGWDGVALTMRRTGRVAAGLDVGYRATGAVEEPSALDEFLTERRVMFGWRAGRLLRAEVEHERWRLRPAEASWVRIDVTRGLGFTLPDERPLLRVAEPLDVAFRQLPTSVAPAH